MSMKRKRAGRGPARAARQGGRAYSCAALLSSAPAVNPDPPVGGHGNEAAGLSSSNRPDSTRLDLPHLERAESREHDAIPVRQSFLDAVQNGIQRRLALYTRASQLVSYPGAHIALSKCAHIGKYPLEMVDAGSHAEPMVQRLAGTIYTIPLRQCQPQCGHAGGLRELGVRGVLHN